MTVPDQQSATRTDPVQTEVLIIGSGPAGASAALFLSTLGVDNVMVTKHR
ncbi:hypothetical protein GCM10020366_24230 [Saccharopolyspora gregorii]